MVEEATKEVATSFYPKASEFFRSRFESLDKYQTAKSFRAGQYGRDYEHLVSDFDPTELTTVNLKRLEQVCQILTQGQPEEASQYLSERMDLLIKQGEETRSRLGETYQDDKIYNETRDYLSVASTEQQSADLEKFPLAKAALEKETARQRKIFDSTARNKDEKELIAIADKTEKLKSLLEELNQP